MKPKIAVCVGCSTTAETIKELERVQQKADLIELRIDFIKDINEENLKRMLEKKRKGVILTNRIKSWCDIYNDNKLPFSSLMFGVGKFSIESKEECLIRIKELCELTGFQVLSWLETCILEVLAKEPSGPVLNVKKLLHNIRTETLGKKDVEPIKLNIQTG